VSHYTNVFSRYAESLHQLYYKLLRSICSHNSLSEENVVLVSLNNVQEAIKQLKRSENLDSDGICSKFLAFDCPAMKPRLQLLFQMFLSQSLVLDNFLSGNVTSVLKHGKPAISCSSYHPITVSCVFRKNFEYVTFIHITSKCDFTPFQFGFRKTTGCRHIFF
jgi:hypothetical protein